MTEKTLLQQYVQIGVVVAAYWFISITLGKIISPVSEKHIIPVIILLYSSVCEQVPAERLCQAGRPAVRDLVPVRGHRPRMLRHQAARQILPRQGGCTMDI